MNQPIICFGQQPCGFFPKRFLVAKINTAKKIRDGLGGKIVFFYHDSDADYRETITIMTDRQTGGEARLNFIQENKLQKKFSPLYAKRIPDGWKEEIKKQLPRFTDQNMTDLFMSVNAKTAADFCLEMYQKMGLLDGIEIARSGDKQFRLRALDLDKDYFADVEYQNEVVRARVELSTAPTTSPASRVLLLEKEEGLQLRGLPPIAEAMAGVVGVLHEGGNQFIRFPIQKPIEKWQKNPARDQRFGWMQSVLHATHYIYGEGEKGYLKPENFPDVKFVDREKIDRAEYAWLEN